jgi:excisionase family DNA binding protein
MFGDVRRSLGVAERGCSLVRMAIQTAPEHRPDAMLRPVDAARIANVSLSTIRREIDRGELRARHVGRQLRIDPADFRSYLDREAGR